MMLVIIAIRSVVWSARTFVALRKLHRLESDERISARSRLFVWERRCANRAALLQAAFYCFGTVLFVLLLDSYRTLGDGKLPLGSIVALQMGRVFGYALWCSLLFFAVHVLQWLTLSRVVAATQLVAPPSER